MFIKSMDNAFSLKGKTAIVTGGQKGIGLGISTAFAHQGANVIIMARDEAAAKEVIEDFKSKYGGKFAFFKTDIADFQSCRDSVAAAVKEFGSIDVLVNNAGIGTVGDLLDMDEDLTSWFECINVDLNGAVRMSYLLCKHMRDAGKGGRIINITSNAGKMCNQNPRMIAYASAKAGLNHFTEVLASEVCQYGIRVNAIAPGFTFSNFSKSMTEEGYKAMCKDIPIGRFAEAIEMGALAAYLASEASDAMTGHVLTIDGGYSLTH
jgi:NAD(P)-dependent dehydrogenase (short-subunit alcohol dehydrogenase family)